MNFRDVQRVRDVSQSRKLETLIDGILEEGAHERSGLLIQLELSLRNAKEWKFSTDVYHALTVIKKEPGKHHRKVIIMEDEYENVCKRERKTNLSVYDFLDDYLGLSGNALSLGEMQEKYAKISTPFSNERQAHQWYSSMVIELLKGVRRDMYGPGKKEF